MAAFMPEEPSVRMRLAPKARNTLRRSSDIVSGMVRVIGYPRAAATKASAMPVLPLVGSISALPGLRRPRFSASHTIDAPMRSFTEKAGLRPSTFARTTARAPLTTRFRRTSGVRPRLYELSSKTANSNLPVQHEPVLSLGPARHELGKGRAVDNGGDRAVDIVPHGGKGRVGFPPLAGAALHRPFHVTENVPHRDRLRGTRQQVATFGAAARFDEPALLEAGQDQFQKLLRNALPPCNFRDLDRLARRLRREIEDGLQGVFAFDGDVQTEIVRQGGGWRISGWGLGPEHSCRPAPIPGVQNWKRSPRVTRRLLAAEPPPPPGPPPKPVLTEVGCRKNGLVMTP